LSFHVVKSPSPPVSFLLLSSLDVVDEDEEDDLDGDACPSPVMFVGDPDESAVAMDGRAGLRRLRFLLSSTTSSLADGDADVGDSGSGDSAPPTLLVLRVALSLLAGRSFLMLLFVFF
jgi:hypothetical protein